MMNELLPAYHPVTPFTMASDLIQAQQHHF